VLPFITALVAGAQPCGGLACAQSALTRRQACATFGALCAAPVLPRPARAELKSYTAEEAAAACARIAKARGALKGAERLISSKRFDDVRAILTSEPVTDFETDCTVLVQSSVLTAPDKKDIGTIRRYGVGADVLIMLGGLSEALDNGKQQAAQEYLAKAIASIDDVLAIARTYNELQKSAAV